MTEPNSTPAPAPSAKTDKVFITVPMEVAPVDTVLAYPLHVKINGQAVPLRNKGDVLTKDRVEQLRKKNVEALFIARTDWITFTRSLEEELKAMGEPDGSEEQAIGIGKLLSIYFIETQETCEIGNNIYRRLKELTAQVPLAMLKNRELAVKLLRRYDDPTLYYSAHAVHTIIYSVAIAMKMGLPLPELQDVSLAACLANIGNIRIPRAVLFKVTPLTHDEYQLVRRHVTVGADILKSLLVPKKLVEAVRHHHERFDGAGYPDGLEGENIPLLARMVSIGEVYSSLTNTSPWRKAVPGHEAVDTMQKGMIGKFDMNILKKL